MKKSALLTALFFALTLVMASSSFSQDAIKIGGAGIVWTVGIVHAIGRSPAPARRRRWPRRGTLPQTRACKRSALAGVTAYRYPYFSLASK